MANQQRSSTFGSVLTALVDFINGLNQDVVPIIGNPGAGKTFFLASLAQWVLANLEKKEKVFLEGEEYLHDLIVRISNTDLDPVTRLPLAGGLVGRTLLTGDEEADLHRVLIRIPALRHFGLTKSIDLFTVDAPGEILISEPELLEKMVHKIRGLIFLVDVIGDDAKQQTLDWPKATADALSSSRGVGSVVTGKLNEETPVALVVTKWDRVLTLPGFETRPEREAKFRFVERKLRNTYRALVGQYNVAVFPHTSIGEYSSMEEADLHGQECYPNPTGLTDILNHVVGK